MEIPTSLMSLAQLLEMRKKSFSRPYHLLLTSTISLTPEVLINMCGSDDWSDFRHYMLNLGTNDRLSTLAHFLNTRQNLDGYNSLARLIKDGYFSTILTTNLDSNLEDALVAEAVFPPAFQTLVLGRDPDKYIDAALTDPSIGISIVKLHGSLREKAIPLSFPDFFEIPGSIREGVKRYLNQDIIIVGSIEPEDDIIRSLAKVSTNSIYYVIPQQPSFKNDAAQIIAKGDHRSNAFLVSGTYGDFETFFKTLALTLGASVQNSAEKNESALSEDQQLPTFANIQPPSNIASRYIDHNSDIHTSTPSLVSSSNKTEALGSLKSPHADVLLVTVTDIEARAVLDLFPNFTRHSIGGRAYYDLGFIHSARVSMMVQQGIGSSGPGGSLLTIRDGIQALSPSTVVMVGIAFGFDPKRQRIGDILVSRQILTYELQRIASSSGDIPAILPRGELFSASVRLLDRFISGSKDWQESKVQFGLILSGEKIVDHLDFQKQLHQLEPEAIGGEMEGAGLWAAAQRYKVDWILVKGICDWADGKKAQNKSQRQQIAARNAAHFTMHVIQNGGFVAL